MARLIRHSPVMNEIQSGSDSILFSYNTPVSTHINGTIFVIATFYSASTDAHIEAYTDNILKNHPETQSETKHQTFFNNLLTLRTGLAVTA